MTKFSPYFPFTLYCFYAKISSFMPVFTIGIVRDCCYLLIFYSEKFSTWVWRLPFAVNVNLNLCNDAGSRVSNTQYWENLVFVVVLVLEPKAFYCYPGYQRFFSRARRRRLFVRVSLKNWPKLETAHEKSPEPRVAYFKRANGADWWEGGVSFQVSPFS